MKRQALLLALVVPVPLLGQVSYDTITATFKDSLLYQPKMEYVGIAQADSNITTDGARQETASSLTSRANTQFNVMAPPFNARGDCLSNDYTAITAAMTAAAAYSPSAVVYFPKPPGGCYLTSTLTNIGVSLIGQPSGANGQYNVIIKGMPGYDVMETPDPSIVTAYKWNKAWSMKDITFEVDNSVAATTTTVPNLLHRWPGRWFDDGAIAASSRTFKTTNGEIDCGDIGQAILVTGAGSGGSNLVTTISNVTPCWAGNASAAHSWQVITLSTAASTTVTNAHTYLSLLGLPVTTNIANCGIAWDDRQGKTSLWTTPSLASLIGNLNDTMSNVYFTSTSGNQNNACGIYTQGIWGFYNLDNRNFNFRGLTFAVVQGTAELNAYYQSSSNDFQTWDHGPIEIVFSPWISYNGSNRVITDVEITAQTGPQFLEERNAYYDGNGSGRINIPEFECQSGYTVYGLRLAGRSDVLTNTTFGCTKTMTGRIDGEQNKCIRCAGNINVGGFRNDIDASGDLGNSFSDTGRGNTATANYSSNPLYGLPFNYDKVQIPTKGIGEQVARLTGDNIRDGNPATTYNYDDLFVFPQDVEFNGYGGSAPYSNYVVQDSTSPSNAYMIFGASGGQYGQFSPYVMQGNNGKSLTIGTNVPAQPGTVYFSAKCLTGSSLSFEVDENSDGSTFSTTQSCTPSYQTYSLAVDFTNGSGKSVLYEGTGNTFQVAWIDLVPNRGTLNFSAAQINAQLQKLTGCNTATYLYSPQSGTCVAPPGGTTTICSGTISLGTLPISSGAAASTVTATCPGLATTDDIALDFNASPLGIEGYEPGTSGMLTIVKWPTVNTINVAIVNNTSRSITPGAITLNYHVYR